MAKKNKTKYAILGMLLTCPMSGYDIKKNTDNTINYFWHENYGHIYPVLKKMLQEGLVLCKTIENYGAPSRNVYSITETGKTQFIEWLNEGVEPEKYRKELLLKIFFADHSTPEKVKEKVKKEMTYHLGLLEEYKMVESHIQSHKNDENYSPYWLMTLQNGIISSKAQIEWCKQTLKELE
ncbi:MAG: PadR family transcriptional regulator [Spirochaetes bacterium]|nr:PadR family transcriptional regulator [Spirochaetota bacterium]